MVTKEELEKTNFEYIEHKEEKSSYYVTKEELSFFNDRKYRLIGKLGDFRMEYKKKNNLSSEEVFDKFYEFCKISPETLRKTLSGNLAVTRNFLYKFTVGMGMNLEEANEYFELLDGKLDYEHCKADYICCNAIRDKDDIELFTKQMREYADIILVKKEREKQK